MFEEYEIIGSEKPIVTQKNGLRLFSEVKNISNVTLVAYLKIFVNGHKYFQPLYEEGENNG